MAQYDYNKEELSDFLDENRGYLKWGLSRIQNKFAPSLTERQIDEVRNSVRNRESELNSAKAKKAFNEKLDSLGLSREDVKDFKYWETHDGEPRFSIETRSDYSLNLDTIEKRFEERFGNISTPSISQPRENSSEKCGVLGLHDAHIDKVVLASETGYDTDDTIEENVKEFKQRSLELLYEAKEKGIDKIFVPVGSDFWTVNDDRNTTKRGTDQRVLVPFQESFEVGSEAVIEILRWAAENFPEVEVPVIYGNHDEDMDFFLGMILNQAFKGTTHLNVNYNRVERKYYRFGKNGFMFAHGYHSKTKSALERLPLNFAEEATDIWSQTKGGIRKAFLGDIHNEENYSFLRSKDSVGMNVQFMRSVSNNGKYEWNKGYTGVPKTAYLWTYEENGKSENVSKTVWW